MTAIKSSLAAIGRRRTLSMEEYVSAAKLKLIFLTKLINTILKYNFRIFLE